MWLYQPLVPGAAQIDAAPPIPPVGPAGAATLVMQPETGAKITYSWLSNVMKGWDGTEQRVARWPGPRRVYDCKVLLNDAALAPVLSALVLNAATAQPFLLGLAHEALPLTQNGVSSTVYVPTTTLSDWIQPGQRVVVVAPSVGDASGPDGATTIDSYVVSSTGNTIILNDDVHTVALAGGTIMPADAVYLEPGQKFSRYDIAAGEWQIQAHATMFGFANVATMGAGATVTMYNGNPVWDRGITNPSDQVSQPLASGSKIVDLGGLIDNSANWTVSDWGRQATASSSDPNMRQWLYAFLGAVRGQQVAFYLPTWRPDLTPIGDASSGSLTVVGGAPGAMDYAGQWFASVAQHQIQILLANGTIGYRKVLAAVDNHDGTQTLTLDSSLAGSIAMVSFLELARLASDDVDVTWDGQEFTCTLNARVVQQ